MKELRNLYTEGDDIICPVTGEDKPRKLIVASGPPSDRLQDPVLADMVDRYEGSRLVCGGTTARIISRELGRGIDVVLKRDPAGLPPVSRMEGMDMVTEGVLTLGKVRDVLANSQGTGIPQKGTDGEVARMLLGHDIIEFVVGTKVNPVHRDPGLPVELELRRDLIRELAAMLENKFKKTVKVKYI